MKKNEKMSFPELTFTIVWIFFFSVCVFIEIDHRIINPVNKEKMPENLSELRNKIQRDMNNLTKGLPEPVDERSYYKPEVNSVSESKKFPYNDKFLSIILENVPKDKNLQRLQNEDDETILSYCDYNVHTKIKKESIEEKEYLYIYVNFTERGVCME